jgi:PAS domain S-box-containing protein
MAHAEGSIFWNNDRCPEYTGLSAEQLQGFGWHKVQHPEHVSRIDEGFRRCRQSGDLWEDAFPLLAKDGSYNWFLTRAVPISDSRGNIVRWFGTATDISQQIAAEDEIRTLNQQLQQRVNELETLMQVLPVGIAMAHDRQGTAITGNAAFLQLFESESSAVKPTGAAAKAPGIYVGSKKIKPSELPLPKAALTGRPIGGTEVRLVFADGNVKNVLASASPLFDDSGNSRGSVGAFVDITESKRLDDELRQRGELLGMASEAIMVRGINGELQYWSSGAESVYGWHREEILGRDLHQVLQTEFPIPSAEIEAALIETGSWAGNLRQWTKDGREITVACRKSYNRERSAILETNRDISAQLIAEEALRENEKLAAMGRVAGIIAHEINNPLEAITNAFFLLREHPSLDEEAQHFARLAEQELQRVSHITKQTLGFYRESRQPIAVCISEMLDELIDLQSRKLQRLRISIDRKYVAPGIVHGFPVEFRQVFLNLFSNAVQAMTKGGTLRLRVHEVTDWERQRRYACVAIVDTGGGIKAEDAKRVFQPFFSTKASKGTGLGLWISQEIVQKYEGRISFRTFRGARGATTCFRVLVPLAGRTLSRIPSSDETMYADEVGTTSNGAA